MSESNKTRAQLSDNERQDLLARGFPAWSKLNTRQRDIALSKSEPSDVTKEQSLITRASLRMAGLSPEQVLWREKERLYFDCADLLKANGTKN